MNEVRQLELLMSLLTEGQINLFGRMYPEGPKQSQLKHAIFQCSNTLKKGNQENQDLKAEVKTMEEQLAFSEMRLKNATHQHAATKKELIQALKTKDDTPLTDDDHEKLRFLCALEAAGVDNWEGHDNAHEILEEWDKEDHESGR